MTFWKGGAGKKRDAIEPEMILALKQVGTQVWQINGRGLPDLLTLRRGRWLPLGVKSRQKSRLTPTEARETPSWPIVRTVEDAVRQVIG